MFDYTLYGIGNALVDKEIQLSEEALKEAGIDKGVMTLLNKDQFIELYNRFENDITKRACGGSAANTVIGASQLGATCYYCCHVAKDHRGLFYVDDLRHNGVETQLDRHHLPEGQTGACLVFVTPDADRTMCTYLGITSELDKSQVNEDALKRSQYLYIEGYLSSSPSGVESALHAQKIARDNNVKVALTFSDPAMIQFCRDQMTSIVNGGVDMIFCNEAEALAYTTCETVEEAMSALRKVADTVLITLGPKGTLIGHEDQDPISVEGFSVNAVDTTGAGDIFAGSFLAAYSSYHTLEDSARLANYAASRVVSTYGPRLHKDELNDVCDYYKSLKKVYS